MEALENLSNSNKAQLLHELFPKEITGILNFIQDYSTDLSTNRETYAAKWTFRLMSFKMWLTLSWQADQIINDHRQEMIRNSIVFSEKLCYTFAVAVVNDCIVKYADQFPIHSKFRLLVDLLYK